MVIGMVGAMVLFPMMVSELVLPGTMREVGCIEASLRNCLCVEFRMQTQRQKVETCRLVLSSALDLMVESIRWIVELLMI